MATPLRCAGAGLLALAAVACGPAVPDDAAPSAVAPGASELGLLTRAERTAYEETTGYDEVIEFIEPVAGRRLATRAVPRRSPESVEILLGRTEEVPHPETGEQISSRRRSASCGLGTTRSIFLFWRNGYRNVGPVGTQGL